MVVRLATGRSRNLLSGLTRDRYGRGASLLPAFSGPADLIVGNGGGQVLRVLIFCAAFLPSLFSFPVVRRVTPARFCRYL